MAKDPICGMDVDKTTALSAERNGEAFYFCSEHCRTKFQSQHDSGPPGSEHSPPDCHGGESKSTRPPTASGARYVCPMCHGIESDTPGNCPKCGMSLEPAKPVTTAGSRTIYTCPMHPEIEQDGPGSCPKCGMDLEPKNVADHTVEDDSELVNMTRRFWVAAALGVPVLLLAMLPMLGIPLDDWVGGGTISRWLQFASLRQRSSGRVGLSSFAGGGRSRPGILTCSR